MATIKASRIPAMIYGTAWKKERTRDLVRQAVLAGFRGVDTAAQPKHYREDLVAQGIADAMKAGSINREQLYVQTKYTSVVGQDPRNMPYNPQSSITDQVKESVESSLRNFSIISTSKDETYLDCLVMHSPLPSQAQTQEAWRAMESYVPHTIRTLGISNIYDLLELKKLYEHASIKPSVVQNRFYRDTGYDAGVRAFCEANNIVYQSFWTLTANPDFLQSQPVLDLAQAAKVTSAVALYGFVLGLGHNMSILNGTTNPRTMKNDLVGVHAVRKYLSYQSTTARNLRDDFSALLER
ncbi:hypothetical protein LTS14_004627 [Recurvomyces mirabilis]|nr:hypothetical protein LTS14_004627 [Recurvomyces mirabilis]